MQIQRPKLSHSEYEAKNTNKVAQDLIQTAAKAFVASVVSFESLKDYYRMPFRKPNLENTQTQKKKVRVTAKNIRVNLQYAFTYQMTHHNISRASRNVILNLSKFYTLRHTRLARPTTNSAIVPSSLRVSICSSTFSLHILALSHAVQNSDFLPLTAFKSLAQIKALQKVFPEASVQTAYLARNKLKLFT